MLSFVTLRQRNTETYFILATMTVVHIRVPSEARSFHFQALQQPVSTSTQPFFNTPPFSSIPKTQISTNLQTHPQLPRLHSTLQPYHLAKNSTIPLIPVLRLSATSKSNSNPISEHPPQIMPIPQVFRCRPL